MCKFGFVVARDLLSTLYNSGCTFSLCLATKDITVCHDTSDVMESGWDPAPFTLESRMHLVRSQRFVHACVHLKPDSLLDGTNLTPPAPVLIFLSNVGRWISVGNRGKKIC